MSKLSRKIPCPKCKEEGRDTAGDNLWLYQDGGMYCHAGHGFLGRQSGNKEHRAVKSSMTVDDINALPIMYDPSRGVPEEVYTKYGVRGTVDEESGVVNRLFYPYTSNGVVTGYKIRTLPKKFFISGTLEGLFGESTCSPSRGKTLFITEGEEDALALRHACTGKWDKHDVVSLPNGASLEGGLDKTLTSRMEFIAKYGSVVLCLDNDEAGIATSKRLANWLSGFIGQIKVVSVPLKDPSDHVRQGKVPDLKQAIIKAPRYQPDEVIRGCDLDIKDITRAAVPGLSTPFPDLDRKLHGVRKGEITTICAGTGIGKSTLVKEICYNLVTKHEAVVCHIALEEAVEHTAAGYIALHNSVPAAKFREQPACISDNSIEDSYKQIIKKMYFFNTRFHAVTSGSLINTIRYYGRLGVDYIAIDHLSMVSSASSEANERKEIDRMMTELAGIAVQTGVGILNVVHLKRRESREGKALNEGGQVSLTDLRGSSSLEGLSWSVIALERNQQAEDGSEDYVNIRLLKNRTWGKTGLCGRARYCHSTGRLLPVKEEPVEVIDPTEEKLDE